MTGTNKGGVLAMGRSSEISRKSSKETNRVKFQHLPDVLAVKEKAKSSEMEQEAVKGSKHIHLSQKSKKFFKKVKTVSSLTNPVLCFMSLH